MKRKGMLVYVYRNSIFGDCSINGITNQYDRLLLVGKGVPQLHSEENEEKIVELEVTSTGYMRCRPIVPAKEGNYYCSGGNFVFTSDSRFPSHYPLSVHDRQEPYCE